MRLTQKYVDELTYKVLGCAIEVHKQLGPGLLESVYEKCFIRELELRGLHWKRQQNVPISYKGISTDTDLRFDVLVEDLVIAELKSAETPAPIHEAILLTFIKLLQKPKGILINFNCLNIFREGQRTFVNEYYARLPKM